jgi:ATP-binding cassette subfamily F protein 3
MILLSSQSIIKRFGPTPVLDGVSFELRPGERVGLVGPNGVGKTTLLRILAGLEDADSGAVERHPSAKIGFLEQHPNFDSTDTVWDVACSGMAELIALAHQAEKVAHEIAAATDDATRQRLARRFDLLQHQLQHCGGYHYEHHVERVLHGLELPDAVFRQAAVELSGGQQNRLLLARLLLSQPDVMLLDEPSNHLDLAATQWLEEFLIESAAAIVVVSHDRYFLDRVTNRTLELYAGTVESYPGNFSQYWRLKAERLEVERRTYDKQQEMIEKAEEFIRRNHYGQKAAQAEDRRKKLQRIERVPPPREIAAPRFSFPDAGRTADTVLRVEGLAKAFDRPLFSDLTFEISRGQRWGVLGPNASGKTTLLRCIAGELAPDAGRATLGAGVRIGYLDQLLAGLDPQTELVEAIRPGHKEFNELQRRQVLGAFGLSGDVAFRKVSQLSGGERSRAGLARLAASDANFLVLDEPTNHLDLWARDALEQAIARFEGTVLLVSHDRYFLNRVVDHLLVVEPGRFRVIEGNYDTYRHFLAAGLAATIDHVPTLNTPPQAAPAPKEFQNNQPPLPAVKRKRRFPYRKLPDLEREIFDREHLVKELQLSLAQPEILRDGQRVRQIKAQLEEEQRLLETLYAHWEEATELN